MARPNTNPKFNGDSVEKVEDDPYAELFADCTTAEEVLQLQKEIEEAERLGK